MATSQPTGAVVAGTAVPDAPQDPVGFPPFDTNTYASQLLWLAIFFGLLYWLVSRIFAPRLNGILEDRAGRIAGDLDAAAAAKTQAEAAGQAYEKALAESRAKSQAIAQQTRDSINSAAEARRKTLEADLAAKLAAAEGQIAATKTQAMSNVSEIASEAAALIVQRLGGTAPPATEVASALKTALKT